MRCLAVSITRVPTRDGHSRDTGTPKRITTLTLVLHHCQAGRGRDTGDSLRQETPRLHIPRPVTTFNIVGHAVLGRQGKERESSTSRVSRGALKFVRPVLVLALMNCLDAPCQTGCQRAEAAM